MNAERIRIRGIVQGVGFRPLLWRIAQELDVRGTVRNDGQGVLLEVYADSACIGQLLARLKERLPPLARIDAIEREAMSPAEPPPQDFRISASEAGHIVTELVADAATCPQCLAEINDPADRRYRYPFTNCTNCGPRFSIVRALPYDRANTSMALFPMCPACQSEYDDPATRRFHAQPNACPECGPRLWLSDPMGLEIPCEDVLEAAADMLQAGKILAIKGLGGYQLACDASNEASVARLRERKRRYHKPLALLATDVEMVRRFARPGEQEAALLQSPAAPIVLLQASGMPLAASIAPGHEQLGFALPSTPLHHLLMQTMSMPLVLTSGNVSDEPQCIDNEEALEHLDGIADAFLMHDRAIVNRVDDSVLRISDHQPLTLRRARGYAPMAMRLPPGFAGLPPVLAMGAELKSTFCMTHNGLALVSQHIGDLESAPVLADYRNQLQLYRNLYPHPPDRLALDLHPNYLSSQLGRQMAREQGLACCEVQHHHAHIAAVMAEHDLPLESPALLGIALDGLGMGEEGELWGGEFMRVDYRGFRRLARFDPVPLPGGAQAMREPWRNIVAQLLHRFDWDELSDRYTDLELIDYLKSKPMVVMKRIQERGLNSPPCSSAGRLFDAVAAALGICRDSQGYEGQAAMELETLAAGVPLPKKTYPIAVQEQGGLPTLVWQDFWQALLDDLQQGRDRAEIAACFHVSLAEAIANQSLELARIEQLNCVAVAGGVFQNTLLLKGVRRRLEQAGLSVRVPSRLPMGDGAISLGQAVVALARMADEDWL